MKTIINICLLLLVNLQIFCQVTEIKGTVLDDQGNGLFAATVFLKNHKIIYSITGEEGGFVLSVNESQSSDTIEVRYVGYDTQTLALSSINFDSPIEITLGQNNNTMSEIVISAKAPVAEDFSVKKLDQMDIYFNPIAKGDPLNAIQILPASTNTDESASPSLRGSAPNRSIVVVEGVPVRNPVRYNQLDGVGSFSIFNTDQLKNQWVYASNPPLIYGNSSAGLIEINLIESAQNNGLDLSIGLAQLGAKWSQNFKDNTGYISVYGNKGISVLYKALNPSITNLNDFGTTDLGFRFFKRFNEKLSLSLFNFGSLENYDVSLNLFTHKGDATANQKRNFTVMKLKYGTNVQNITLNFGSDFSNSHFSYGNIDTESNRKESYTALNYRYNHSNFVIQTGINHIYSNDDFVEQIPQYYFAVSPNSPSLQSDTTLVQHDIQTYLYAKFYFYNFVFSGGLRTNVPSGSQEFFFSYQSSTRYNFDNHHSLLLSSGVYHNYNYPTHRARSLDLLKSNHLSLEYQYNSAELDGTFAIFSKKEECAESMINPFISPDAVVRNIKGAEFSVSKKIGKRMILDLANTVLDIDIEEDEFEYEAANDMNYFLKIGLTFYHNDLFSFGLSYVSRPGLKYTSISDSRNIDGLDARVPIFEEGINGSIYNHYHNVSMTFNKLIKLKKDKNLILYLVINNILNRSNQQNAVYSTSYETKTFDDYSKRFIYFGTLINL